MVKFRPSTKPASPKPCRNAVARGASDCAEPGPRKPITGIAVCCARAASGHAAATPPMSVMNSRRRMPAPKSLEGGILSVHANDQHSGRWWFDGGDPGIGSPRGAPTCQPQSSRFYTVWVKSCPHCPETRLPVYPRTTDIIVSAELVRFVPKPEVIRIRRPMSTPRALMEALNKSATTFVQFHDWNA